MLQSFAFRVSVFVLMLLGLSAMHTVFACDDDSDGWGLSRDVSYSSIGVENLIPEKVFDVPVTELEADVRYVDINPHLHFGVRYQRPDTGSGYNDRLIGSIGTHLHAGQFGLHLKHSYVHTDTRRWLNGDSHMTTLRADLNSDTLKPYAFLVSHLSAKGMNDLMLYGGVGVELAVPVDLLVIREINFDLSVSDSFAHSLDRVSAIRFAVGSDVVIDPLGLTVKPNFNVVKDLRTDGYYTWAGVSSPF